MDIITGEQLQEKCDIYIGFEEDFIYNPRINKQRGKCLEIQKIPVEWDNPYIIFIYTHRLSSFIGLMNNIKNNFILVSHNSDENITDKYNTILEHPKLIFWHSQNVIVDHPKLGGLPIGITNAMWGERNIELINKVISRKPSKIRDFYFYFNVSTNQLERNECKHALEKKGLQFDTTQQDYESYLYHLSSHKYAICPSGNGIDCHRTWECLYLGVIPIFKRSIFTQMISKKYRCVLLNNWHDLNTEMLLCQYPGEIYYNTLELKNINIKSPNNYFLMYQ